MMPIGCRIHSSLAHAYIISLLRVSFGILLWFGPAAGRDLTEAELIAREASFVNPFLEETVSLSFDITGIQFGPRSDGPWLFDNDTDFFERKNKGTGFHAPNQVFLVSANSAKGNGSCSSRGSGTHTSITPSKAQVIPSDLDGSILHLEFSDPFGPSKLGNITFFRHINTQDINRDWKELGHAGDQRTYSRGSNAILRWRNGTVALYMKNIMWKEVVTYPNPPKSWRPPGFVHRSFLEGDIDESVTTRGLLHKLDPDGLRKVYATLQYKNPGTNFNCFMGRDIELRFVAVRKPVRVISPSTNWEVALGKTVGISYTVLAGLLLFMLLISQAVLLRYEQLGPDVMLGGIRRCFQSFLIAAGMGQLFLDVPESSRAEASQLSWLLLRSFNCHEQNLPYAHQAPSTFFTDGGISPLHPPLSEAQLRLVTILSFMLIGLPTIVYALCYLVPARHRSVPVFWVQILGDWGMFAGLLAAFQVLIFHLRFKGLVAKFYGIEIVQVVVLLIITVPIYIGLNIFIAVQGYRLQTKKQMRYIRGSSSEAAATRETNVRERHVHGYYQAADDATTFHLSNYPFYELYKGNFMYSGCIDVILLAATAILIGSLRSSITAAVIGQAVPVLVRFCLTILISPIRYRRIGLLFISISFIDAVIACLSLASIFFERIRWFFTSQLLLRVLLIPLMAATVWVSDLSEVVKRARREDLSKALGDHTSPRTEAVVN